MPNLEPFTGFTLKTSELRHLMDRAEASWRAKLKERRADLFDEDFADQPDITLEIGASVERIEIALDDLFVMRAAYTFDPCRTEVRVPIDDLLNLLMETDFT
jgi:hypothetical protein